LIQFINKLYSSKDKNQVKIFTKETSKTKNPH